ncbi:MAG: hypothetical protein ACYS0G_11700 [Planctomycetota bacterium]|jgi:hypothetical protein
MIDRTTMTTRRAPGAGRYRWGLAVALASLFITAAATPVTSAHNDDRPRAKWRSADGSNRVRFGIRYGASHRRHGHQRFERGYAAGRRAGWSNGLNDALYRHRFRPGPDRRLHGRSIRYVNGYTQGYVDAYHEGYRQGQRTRWRAPARGCRSPGH